MAKKVLTTDPFDQAPAAPAPVMAEPRTSSGPSTKQRTVRVTIDLPEGLHRQARYRSLDESRSLNEIGVSLFRAWLGES